MNNYENVTVDKLANIYFDGNVISRNITFQDGSKKTLGVMLPGEYEFSTQSKELMEIMSKNKIRHIPIMEKHKLLGIVSIGDVVSRIIENYAYETRHLREYINS